MTLRHKGNEVYHDWSFFTSPLLKWKSQSPISGTAPRCVSISLSVSPSALWSCPKILLCNNKNHITLIMHLRLICTQGKQLAAMIRWNVSHHVSQGQQNNFWLVHYIMILFWSVMFANNLFAWQCSVRVEQKRHGLYHANICVPQRSCPWVAVSNDIRNTINLYILLWKLVQSNSADIKVFSSQY